MNALDIVSFIVSGAGVLSGIIIAFTALSAAKNGDKSTLVQVSTFLQSEVRRLSEENDQLLQDKYQLQQEVDRLNRMVRTLRTRRGENKP